MSRKDEFKNQNPNPAQNFLEWKSNDKCFGYYDNDKKENVLVKLPLKFLTLKELHTVKGWNDASESAIFSNEVSFISTEPLKVKSFKGGPIAEGLYKDIRQEVVDAGGHYVKSIYVMHSDGYLTHVSLKGSAVREWGEFTKKARNRLADEWVEVTEALEMKKGSIKYTVPVFKFSGSLNKKAEAQADDAYETLEGYLSKFVKREEAKEEALQEASATEEDENGGLPF